ncbi:uncharacterized protein LOC119674951 [Teleopsis dalmanni]|uniref:uncharacterized protein LOC119674951 n=1 Tax=Teleopsis dalmanni TaxID=139649 RepID=UPI0018CD2D0F|nr:uncharacterized protein LOC119674951 [Teleopsis dalmanni]
MSTINDKFFSPFVEDPPRAFTFIHVENQKSYYGPYLQAIINFVAYKKYNLELETVDTLNSSEIFDKIRRNIYNTSLHGVTCTDRKKLIQYSYPLEITKKCILVPLDDEIPKFWYVGWPFDRYIWITLFCSIFYIAILMSFIEYPKQTASNSILRNIPYSVAILLYCPNMNIQLRNAPIRVIVFYTLLFVFGFIFSAYYFPYLTAYNMKPVFRERIRTLSDILDAKLVINVPSSHHESFEEYTQSNERASLLRSATVVKFKPIVKYLNHSAGYVILEDTWRFLHMQQFKMYKPLFSLSEECFGWCYKAFPVHVNASFLKELDSFLLRVKASGLWLKWKTDAGVMALRAKYGTVLLDDYPVEPLKLSYYRFAWIVLAAGTIASCLAALCEIYVWNKHMHTELIIVI